MSDISVIILAKDEKLHIGRCLDRLRDLNPRQIFVVDCFSTDGTQEIVKQCSEVVPSCGAEEFRKRAVAKVEEWLDGISEDVFVAVLDKLMDAKILSGEYRFKGNGGRAAMREGAIRFFREFSRRIVQLSDGRCVYFTPDERAKKRNADNAVSWAEYAVHAVTNGGKRLPGKTYNERCLNYHKIEGFNLIEQTLRNERCVVRINDDPRYDAIMFGGEDVAGRIVNVVTRLDDFGNIDANLTEVTFEASSKRNKKPPRLMPLAEAIGTVVHRQVAAGSNPSTADSIANSDFRGKGYRTIVSVVEHEWPGLYAKQFNWALDNLPIETKWVLRMDADEYLTEATIERLKNDLPTLPDDVSGLNIELKRKFRGGEIRHGTNGIMLLRVFRYGVGRCEERAMDEHIVLSRGQCIDFDGAFYDDNLNTFEWWQEKHRGYAKREAMDAISLFNNPDRLKNPSATDKKKIKYYKLPPYLRAFAYFCIRYFLKFGFLDGLPGFRWHFWQGLWYRWLVDREIGRMKNTSL